MDGFIALYVIPDQLRDYLAGKTAIGYSVGGTDNILLYIPIGYIEKVFNHGISFKKPKNSESQWS